MKKCLSFFTVIAILAISGLFETIINCKTELIAEIPPITINPPIKTQVTTAYPVNIVSPSINYTI